MRPLHAVRDRRPIHLAAMYTGRVLQVNGTLTLGSEAEY